MYNIFSIFASVHVYARVYPRRVPIYGNVRLKQMQKEEEERWNIVSEDPFNQD